MEYPEEHEIRKQKRAALEARGEEAYARSSARTHMCADARQNYAVLAKNESRITTAGRIRQMRKHGGSCFARIEDNSGTLQWYLKKDVLGAERYTLFSDMIDLGDVCEATGTLFTTKTGEATLLVESFRILAKALLPLPDQWHGLSDTETRFRHRELDCIAHADTRQRFTVRSRLISAFRTILAEQGFLEVETPILQIIPGGANARPFMTHHNALDADLYLRIAPELYLKRLIIAGFEKIYEIGRLFRNEGIDHAHSPEFTAMELYWAYAPGRNEFIQFLETMIRQSISEAVGALSIVHEDTLLEFGSAWRAITFREAILEATDIDIDAYTTEAELENTVKKNKLSIDFDGCVGIGECYDMLFKKTARERMSQPTWVYDYPVELKPLAAAADEDLSKSASCQLIVKGAEIVNAYYHELTDPIVQRKRFLAQEALRQKGSEQAQFLDEDFLFALEHGMPPTCGMGIGIDRLVMLITGQKNIRETILFPTLRQKH